MSKRNYTPRSREERAEEIQAIQADLEAKVAALTTTEDWVHALDVAAKFHRYSLNNLLWLMMQGAEREMDVTQVAGFRAWQKLGRNVRKGEKSLKVLAPARYKVADERTGEDRWVVRGFTVASVFDVSQTDGDDLPDVAPALLTEGGEPAVLAKITDLIAARGFETLFVEPETLRGANGRTLFETKQVHVRNDVELAQRLKTAVHELAHVTLHSPEQINYASNQDRCEVEAESVAYVVLTHLGIAAEDYSLPYVAGWSRGDAKVVRASAETVVKAAREIVEALVGAEAPVAA
jgi:antirestriction protein ArdC